MALHGVAVNAMIPALKAKGLPVPKHYAPPELLPGLDEWAEAFYELSSDRQLTDHIRGQIPAGSIARHTSGWGADEAELFRFCIRAADAAFLDAMAPPKDGETKGGLPEAPGTKSSNIRRGGTRRSKE